GVAGTLGIGQDHPPAHFGRTGISGFRQRPLRRSELVGRARAGKACRIRVSTLRALPSYDGREEHRLWSNSTQPAREAVTLRNRGACCRVALACTARGSRKALSQPTLRRPAPAWRAGTGTCHRAPHIAARRTV